MFRLRDGTLSAARDEPERLSDEVRAQILGRIQRHHLQNAQTPLARHLYVIEQGPLKY